MLLFYLSLVEANDEKIVFEFIYKKYEYMIIFALNLTKV